MPVMGPLPALVVVNEEGYPVVVSPEGGRVQLELQAGRSLIQLSPADAKLVGYALIVAATDRENAKDGR